VQYFTLLYNSRPLYANNYNVLNALESVPSEIEVYWLECSSTRLDHSYYIARYQLVKNAGEKLRKFMSCLTGLLLLWTT
jgi:hypothetical protein